MTNHPSPEHEAFVARLIESQMRTPESVPPAEVIAAIRATEGNESFPERDDVRFEMTTLGGRPCLLAEPLSGANSATVLYLHGGGYIWMNARSYAAVAASVATACGARCLVPDYRRAPEDPHPAAVHDVVAAHRALIESGTPPGSIVFAGDSAGGGLVLAALLELRDRGVPLPAAAVSVSPWTDLAVTGASADTADDPVVSGTALRSMAATYLAGADPRTPTASPLYADLAGLPPLQIQVGTRESLLDDSRRFVERARAAGVEVDTIEHEGVVHMWLVFDPELPESRHAFELIGQFVHQHSADDHPLR